MEWSSPEVGQPDVLLNQPTVKGILGKQHGGGPLLCWGREEVGRDFLWVNAKPRKDGRERKGEEKAKKGNKSQPRTKPVL